MATNAVLFDLDGTLLDTALDFFKILNALRAEYDKSPLNFAELRLWVAKGVDVLVAKSFDLAVNQPGFDVIKAKFLDRYEAELGHYAVLFPGMAQLLNCLEEREVPWGIVTDKFQRFTGPLLSQYSWAAKAVVVSGDSVAERKPSPMPLLEACARLGVNPRESVYVGDSYQDMQAGKAAGMKTIGVMYGYNPDEMSPSNSTADYCVCDCFELIACLEVLLEQKL